jgi:rubrerythrin
MSAQNWTLDSIEWERFDPSKVDSEILKVIKAASLVEFNARDYAAYLCNVFGDDPKFKEEVERWAGEEVQHGEALGRWAVLADPEFDFEGAVERFRAGFQVPIEVEESVRGSRCGELVARCIVEVGTSSYYGSLMDAVEEPVLKEICRLVAADELRHYKLFYGHQRRYLDRDNISRLRRFLIAVGRMTETEDDELAYAYFAANAPLDATYDHDRYSRAYMYRACSLYNRRRVERGAAMICKAAGISPQSRFTTLFSRLAYYVIRSRRQRLAPYKTLAA